MMDLNQVSFKDLLKKKEPIENRKFISSSSFQKIGLTNNITIKNCTFSENITFHDCRFFETVTFEECTFFKNFELSNVEFAKEVVFKSCSLSDQSTFNCCTVYKIIFIDCHFKNLEFTGFLKSNISTKSVIEFQKQTSKEIRFENLDCNVNIRLYFASIESLTILNSTFHSEISLGHFENQKYFISENIYFQSSKFHNRIDFYNGTITKQLYVHKVEFEEQVVMRRNFEVDWISFTEVRAKYNVSVDFHDNFDSLSFTDCWFNSSFTVHIFEKQLLHEKRIKINFSGVIYGNYIFEDIPTLSIDISCINFGNIFFHNTGTKFILFNKFFNYNKLFFNSIRYDKKNVLVIYDSNIGNTEFENIDFRKFDELCIAKSDVSNMLLINSVFPAKIQIKTTDHTLGYIIPDEEKINDNTYFRESYRQLKVAMEKMGNRYYSLNYKSKELYYQRKEIKWGADKILLYINYLSNNNGISWIRGILFTLCCGLLSFLYLQSYSLHPIYSWTYKLNIPENWAALKLGFKSYISFISSYPGFKSFEIESNWKTDFVILLTRIFVSVGIYQTITAFRKYGNK